MSCVWVSADPVFKRDSHDDLIFWLGIKTTKIVADRPRAVHALFHSWSKSLFAVNLSRDHINLNFA